MRKILALFILLGLSLSISSCQIQDENTKALIAQYESYIASDIAKEASYYDFINEVSIDLIPGIVFVKMTVRDQFNLVVRTDTGTGFIYQVDDDIVRVVTAYDLISFEQDSYYATYEVIDFADRTYPARLEDQSLQYQMAKLRFSTNIQTAKIHDLDIASQLPMIDEPIMMLSNYQQVRNAMLMGFLENKDETSESYTTTMPIDEFCLGGVIINMRKEIIGMIVRDDDLYIVSVDALNAYLNQSNITEE